MSAESPVSTVSPGDNVAIAFALVIGAGAATALGAVVVFIPRLVQYANRRTLAGALGLSAGVMTYVSFVEIFNKSTIAFATAGLSQEISYIYSTCCFFGGVIFMVVLNYFVTYMLGGHHHHRHDIDQPGGKRSQQGVTGATESVDQLEHQHQQQEEDMIAPAVACICHHDDPVDALEKVKKMAREMEDKDRRDEDETRGNDNASISISSLQGGQQEVVAETQMVLGDRSDNQSSVCHHEGHHAEDHCCEEGNAGEEGNDGEEPCEDDVPQDNAQAQAKLLRMSINTAVAIGLHNFPEGLATFVAALSDPSVGLVLAIAIAIHNIPEGLCVAMPVYYVTGSKWKAFGWACLSGISEPFAALLGWAVLARTMNDVVYAILFGLVAGMMVIISVKELLPTAHRYDPQDTVVTYFFMAGMAIMALSLVLFKLPK